MASFPTDAEVIIKEVKSFMGNFTKSRTLHSRTVLWFLVVLFVPLLLGFYVLGALNWDLTVPFIYGGADDVWQLALTKMLKDTGWVLTNPFLGAPDVAHWHQNAAAQTSALHSVLMLGLSYFFDDAVKVQQVYFLINFSLISLSSFAACRMLGISRSLAFCVGLLFAFTPYRFGFAPYAFLPNYFLIPLALLPIIWIACGEYSNIVSQQDSASKTSRRLTALFLSRKFILGFIFISLITLSDGYYAFFCLLLIFFAYILNSFRERTPFFLSITVPIAYIATIFFISFALILPLSSYKKTHLHEFYKNGVEDSALQKHPFEAEVYSTSLKMLLMPIHNHRLPFLATLGEKIIATSDAARSFKTGRDTFPLGLLGSSLFILVMFCLSIPNSRIFITESLRRHENANSIMLNSVLTSLIFFIFLFSIVGGLGTIVALIFPDIRAYNRFPIFMLFLCYAWGANLLSSCSKEMDSRRKLAFFVIVIIIVGAALYDQIPANAARGSLQTEEKFLSERRFVQNIEASVPPGSMIYQYPYSDYLTENKYYGWGSFAPIRLYLHSKALHWSNGAAKNSYVENWQQRIGQLSFDDMLNEIEAVGFAGMVIDRTVVPDPEYAELAQALSSRGVVVIDDPASHLAFAKLNDNGFRLEYEPDYVEAARLVVTDRSHLNFARLPSLISSAELANVLSKVPAGETSFVIERSANANVFSDGATLLRRMGMAAIPPADMIGNIVCPSGSPSSQYADGNVALSITNLSNFDWRLGNGTYPIGIGAHVSDKNNNQVRWDNGVRFPMDSENTARAPRMIIESGKSVQVLIPISKLGLAGLPKTQSPFQVEFSLVQDGNAWFNNLRCTVSVNQ
jgi:hypothetical protein